MNLKYFVVKGKKKFLSIYVRFWDSKRIDQKARTGISVVYEDWSEKKQRIKVKPTADNNADLLNSKLRKLEDFIIAQYNLDYSSKKTISKSWLKDTVSDFFGRVEDGDEYKAFLVPWVEKFIKEAPNRLYRGKKIKPRSIKNYEAALKKLQAFEKSEGKKYRFEDVDLVFHQKFVGYCREKEKLNDNSIGNIINRIKTFCREIEFEGYTINPQYKSSNFNAPKNETFDTYLNEAEIEEIYKKDFSDNERLDNARDLLIIGLRTGLRVSDFMRISPGNVVNGNVINITTTKTNQNLTIPIHPQFQKILDKRNGSFPNRISDQKFNKYVKEVCEKSGIKTQTYGSVMNPETKRKETKLYPKHKLISSHCCRRSFATNLYAAGIDTSVIMKATGHKTESQFIKYIKLSNEEDIERISEYWENQNKTSKTE